jgi:hypothetical protein
MSSATRGSEQPPTKQSIAHDLCWIDTTSIGLESHAFVRRLGAARSSECVTGYVVALLWQYLRSTIALVADPSALRSNRGASDTSGHR